MTIATISTGRLRGEDLDGLHVFRGIPFARPPVGELRWCPPQPPEPWDGVRDATRFGPAALQVQSPMTRALAMDIDETSEDCLTLNVWTPGLEGSRPVMVWIHGGAFVIGAGSQPLFDGSTLARRGDVVVVTLNYRLGIFGFLHGRTSCGDALDATGNEGLLDQVAALRWVRDEIAAFGGDPRNLTVFGESAGAISIAALLGVPAARGIFQRAILQSGSANLLTAPEAASAITGKVLAHLGLEPHEAGRLRDVPAPELLAVQEAVPPPAGRIPYAPVVDGAVIPRSPFEVVAGRGTIGMPLLVGTNAEEMKLFAFLDAGVFQLDDAGLIARADAVTGGRGAIAVDIYRAARDARRETTTPFDLYEAMMSDYAFRHGAMRLAELQSAHTAPVFAYLFTQQSPSLGGLLGACHGLDLPFVFGTFGLEAMKVFAGEGPGIAALSVRIQDAWLAFARSGMPGHEALPPWPAYDTGRRATMLLGPECAVVDAPMEPERAFWDRLAAQSASADRKPEVA